MAIDAAKQHDEAFNAKDPEARLATEDPDIEAVLPGGLELRGRDQLMEIVKAFWQAMPDAQIVVHDHFAAGDVVVAEGVLVGTHTGPFRTPQGEVPPSGNRVTLRYASVKHIREGLVAREHLYFDQLEFLQQIGALPVQQG